MILDEVRVNEERYNYRFYLTQNVTGRSALRPGASSNLVSGRVMEKGDDWVRVRQSKGYRMHNDTLIPLSSILYITELYTAE